MGFLGELLTGQCPASCRASRVAAVGHNRNGTGGTPPPVPYPPHSKIGSHAGSENCQPVPRVPIAKTITFRRSAEWPRRPPRDGRRVFNLHAAILLPAGSSCRLVADRALPCAQVLSALSCSAIRRDD